MASPEKVKTYIACWLQLGKQLVDPNKGTVDFDKPVVTGDRYSTEFESCWQQIIDQEGKNYHLEGTSQTIEELLSSSWEIFSCARCQMPTPKLELGIQDPSCPCVDLPLWPNTELPLPRPPVNNRVRLDNIRERLFSKQRSDS